MSRPVLSAAPLLPSLVACLVAVAAAAGAPSPPSWQQVVPVASAFNDYYTQRLGPRAFATATVLGDDGGGILLIGGVTLGSTSRYTGSGPLYGGPSRTNPAVPYWSLPLPAAYTPSVSAPTDVDGTPLRDAFLTFDGVTWTQQLTVPSVSSGRPAANGAGNSNGFVGRCLHAAAWAKASSAVAPYSYATNGVFVYGGVTRNAQFSTASVLDELWLVVSSGGSWVQVMPTVDPNSGLTRTPGARAGHALVSLSHATPLDRLLLVGGVSTLFAPPSADVWASDDSGLSWTMVHDSTATFGGRVGHGMAVVDGLAYLMGGLTTSALVPANDIWRATDGWAATAWVRVTDNAGWSPRAFFGSALPLVNVYWAGSGAPTSTSNARGVMTVVSGGHGGSNTTALMNGGVGLTYGTASQGGPLPTPVPFSNSSTSWVGDAQLGPQGYVYDNALWDYGPDPTGAIGATVGSSAVYYCDYVYHLGGIGQVRADSPVTPWRGTWRGVDSANITYNTPIGDGSARMGMQRMRASDLYASYAPPQTAFNRSLGVVPAPCSAGTYGCSSTGTGCHPCGVGSYSAVDGAASCYLCPGGTYQNQVAQTSCTACPYGMYTPNGVGSFYCTQCPQGQYAVSPGYTSCSTPSPGPGCLENCPYTGSNDGDSNTVTYVIVGVVGGLGFVFLSGLVCMAIHKRRNSEPQRMVVAVPAAAPGAQPNAIGLGVMPAAPQPGGGAAVVVVQPNAAAPEKTFGGGDGAALLASAPASDATGAVAHAGAVNPAAARVVVVHLPSDGSAGVAVVSSSQNAPPPPSYAPEHQRGANAWQSLFPANTTA